MTIENINLEEFEEYNWTPGPTRNMAGIERSWWCDDEHNLLAVILEDRYDKDWAFVLLGKDSDDEYRALKVEASFDTKSKAESHLFTTIKLISVSGESKELLYKSCKDIIQVDTPKIITSFESEIKQYLNRNPQEIYKLTSRKFEELIASILEDLGFDIELTQATRDGGKDIIASIKTGLTNILAYIECKHFNPQNKVGVSIIREVLGVHQIMKPSKSIIITSSSFTKDAKKTAESFKNQLDLKDFLDIKNWLSKYI